MGVQLRSYIQGWGHGLDHGGRMWGSGLGHGAGCGVQIRSLGRVWGLD